MDKITKFVRVLYWIIDMRIYGTIKFELGSLTNKKKSGKKGRKERKEMEKIFRNINH